MKTTRGCCQRYAQTYKMLIWASSCLYKALANYKTPLQLENRHAINSAVLVNRVQIVKQGWEKQAAENKHKR